MTFEKMKKVAQPLLNQVLSHPFNIQLFKGTLPATHFEFFLSQDAVYLANFSKVLLNTAARLVQPHHKKAFRKFAEETIAAEQDMQRKFVIKKPAIICPPVADYIKHHNRHTTYSPVEVAVASFVPCFWLYAELGKQMQEHVSPDHPYVDWVNSYACPGFHAATDEIISIMDEIKTEQTEKEMINAFLVSTQHEINFWEATYLSALYPERSTRLRG